MPEFNVLTLIDVSTHPDHRLELIGQDGVDCLCDGTLVAVDPDGAVDDLLCDLNKHPTLLELPVQRVEWTKRAQRPDQEPVVEWHQAPFKHLEGM